MRTPSGYGIGFNKDCLETTLLEVQPILRDCQRWFEEAYNGGYRVEFSLSFADRVALIKLYPNVHTDVERLQELLNTALFKAAMPYELSAARGGDNFERFMFYVTLRVDEAVS